MVVPAEVDALKLCAKACDVPASTSRIIRAHKANTPLFERLAVVFCHVVIFSFFLYLLFLFSPGNITTNGCTAYFTRTRKRISTLAPGASAPTSQRTIL